MRVVHSAGAGEATVAIEDKDELRVRLYRIHTQGNYNRLRSKLSGF
jgi:hypothetical protein